MSSLVLVTGTVGAQGDGASLFQVVANPSVPINSLSKEDLSDVFLAKVTTWEDGSEVHAVDLRPDSDVRKTFSRAIHGRNVSEIKSFWNRMLFTGRAVPPIEVKSDKEVLAYVRSTSGAIGYIAARTDVGSGVRVLEIEGDPFPIIVVPPRYPPRLERRGVEGFVTLLVSVTESGDVESVTVLEAEPEGLFEDAATQAVMQWKYKPRVVNGQRVRGEDTPRITFAMDER